MTKAEAEQEAIRRFRLLAEDEQTYETADSYAARLAEDIDFPSMTNRRRLIAAWLIREVARSRGRWEDYAAA